MGFYSVTPGSGEYVVGSPMFKKITINLGDSKKFVIMAPLNSKEHFYIKSATLNRNKYTRNFLSHSDIIKGGVFSLEMDSKPNLERGKSEEDKPFSLSK